MKKKSSVKEEIKKIKNKGIKGVVFHLTDTYFIKDSKIGNEIDLLGFGRIRRILELLSNNTEAKNILFLHSGDFLFPSFLSNFFKGKQMVELLNHCGLNYCTLGNHDFDGGLSILKKRILESKFQYITTNLLPPKVLATQIHRYSVWPPDSPNIALVGVAGKMTENKANDFGFEILNLKISLRKTFQEIRKQFPNVKLLLVLSHMDDSEDLHLKKILNTIWPFNSIILGGHTHKKIVSYNQKLDKCMLIKGRSNARTIQAISLNENLTHFQNKNLKNNFFQLDSNYIQKIKPNKKTENLINSWFKILKNQNKLPSKKTIKKFPKKTIIDGTEESLRKGTTNFGNFVADCIKMQTRADIALINSGHFRSDRKFLEKLTLLDLFNTFVIKEGGKIMVTKLSKKECLLFFRHAYGKLEGGKVLQISKDALKILKNSKNDSKFSVALISDMLLKDEDNFGKILAQNRQMSISALRKSLRKNKEKKLSLIECVIKASTKVSYDPQIRFTGEKNNKWIFRD